MSLFLFLTFYCVGFFFLLLLFITILLSFSCFDQEIKGNSDSDFETFKMGIQDFRHKMKRNSIETARTLIFIQILMFLKVPYRNLQTTAEKRNIK